MKRIALFILLAAGPVSAQISKTLGDFSQLKVFDRIEVTLVPSDENRIELRGPGSKDVEFVTKNDLLKIRMSVGRTLDGDGVKATLYFKELNDVDASEGALITTSATIKTPKMTVTAKEGAQIELNLDVQNVAVKSVTGGIVRLAGSAENMDASLGTGGILQAKPLQTEQTEISISAGGDAEITASELAEASIRAGGNIKIYGHPKQVDKKTTLGGTIEVVN